jgi:hypothetical protein
MVSDKDIIFKGNDGGSTIEAMRIDMSAGGDVVIGAGLYFGDGDTGFVETGDDSLQVRLAGSNLFSFIGSESRLRGPATGAINLLSAGGSASAPVYSFNDDSNTGMYRLSADALAFTTAGSQAMMINAAGLVGIGINASAHQLEVYKSTGATVKISGGNNDSDAVLRLQSGNASGESSIFFGDEDDFDVGKIDYLNAGNHMTFTTGASERMRINSSGKVGIGTTSPAGRLHVEDTVGDAGFTGLMISNRGTGASAYDAIAWRLSDSSGTHWTAAATQVHKEGTWTSTASTRDSRMNFRIIKDDAWVDALALRADGRMLGKVILNSESGSGRWANSGVWKTILDLSSHPGGTLYMCEAAIQSLGGYTGTMLVYKSNNAQYHVIKITNTSGQFQMSGSNVQYRQQSGADQTNTSGFQRIQVVASVGSHS